MRYDFNPDLSQASTMPSVWYFDREAYQNDLKKIFYKSWIHVGRSDQVLNPGDYFATNIGEENIMVVRQSDHSLKGFFNVCRHRAGPIANGHGNSKSLKCQYHGWTYNLDGSLQGAPEFHGVKNFDTKNCKLPEIQVKQWGPLVFAAIDPAMSFEEFVGNGPNDLKNCHLEEMKFFAEKDYELNANWKVYVDNYLEGYHLPTVHPDLCKELDYKNYRVDLFNWYSTQDAPPKASAALYAGGDRPGAYYYWMFPNLMFNIYQGSFQTNIIIPISEDKTIVRFQWYIRSDTAENYTETAKKMPELMRFSDQVQAEDTFICEKVFQNLKSMSYSQGRFSQLRENGVHHFHGLLAKMLGSN